MKNNELAGIFLSIATASIFAPLFLFRENNWLFLILCWAIPSIIIFKVNLTDSNSKLLPIIFLFSPILYLAPLIPKGIDDMELFFVMILYPVFLAGSAILFGFGFYFKKKVRINQNTNQITTAYVDRPKSNYLKTVIFMTIGLILFLLPQYMVRNDFWDIAEVIGIPLGILFMLIAIFDRLINLFRK